MKMVKSLKMTNLIIRTKTLRDAVKNWPDRNTHIKFGCEASDFWMFTLFFFLVFSFWEIPPELNNLQKYKLKT